MEDLAALSDITGPGVVSVLLQRFQQRLYWTYLGDFLISFNPCYDATPNEKQLGLWYRNLKPTSLLPPHPMAVAHRAYRMLQNDQWPQSILLTGRTGSGKTECSKVLVNQLLREARMSPVQGLGPRIIMAQQLLNTLLNAPTLACLESTRGCKMVSLYFRSDGQVHSAALQAYCLEKWHLVHREASSGPFNIFFAMMAGLSERARHQYFLFEQYRLLNRSDSPQLFRSQDEFVRYFEMFQTTMASIQGLGVDQQTRNYAGQELSAILAVLAAILHLTNFEISLHPHNGQPCIANHQVLRAVCDLLSVRQEDLERELLSTITVVRGELVRMKGSVEQCQWNRDLLAVELFSRLIAVIIARINNALAARPAQTYNTLPTLVPISVIESPALELAVAVPANGLEAFFGNMAAERLQGHLYNRVFQRDVESCEAQQLPVYKVKYDTNAELIFIVFGLESGVLNKLSAGSRDPQGSPEALVSQLNADKRLKSAECYVNPPGKTAKSTDSFVIRHSGLAQVTYSARDFISKNRSTLPEPWKQILRSSGNPLVVGLADIMGQPQRVSMSGAPPLPDASYATATYRNDLNYLQSVLDSSTLHHVRCLRPNTQLTPNVCDQSLVASQLKECSAVEMALQRKFGYSTSMTHEQFIRSYRDLFFTIGAVLPSTPPDACKAVLVRAGLQDKGIVITQQSVFLRYWHVNMLHVMKAERLRRLVVVQAYVRGYQARKQYRERLKFQRRRVAGRQLEGEFRRQLSAPLLPLQDVHRDPHFRQASLDLSSSFLPEYDEEEECGIVDPNDLTGLFYKQVVSKVRQSLPTLESSTWMKLIYLERDRQVARAYVQEQSIIVDGSHAAFDGERIGIGAFVNRQMDDETAFYKSRIAEGLRLKKDQEGNILACRLCDQPIFVKATKDEAGNGSWLTADLLLCQGQLPLERTVKIFEADEFRSKISLELKKGTFTKDRINRACVMGLCFGLDDADDLRTPCWLCIVNVKAMADVENNWAVRQAQLQTAKKEMTTPEQEEAKRKSALAKIGRLRDRWAKTDQREHLREKEAGGRQIRQQLRAKNMKVGEHLGYSWENESGEKSTTMEALHQMMDTSLDLNESRASGGSGARGWAKVETVVRDVQTKANYERQKSSPGVTK